VRGPAMVGQLPREKRVTVAKSPSHQQTPSKSASRTRNPFLANLPDGCPIRIVKFLLWCDVATAIMVGEGSFGRQKKAAHWVGKLDPSRRNPSATMSLRSASPECVPGPLIIPPSSQRPFREAIVVSWLWRAPPV